MSINTITLAGNLTTDPELRYTAQGKAVVNLTIASTDRVYDRQAGEWKDGDTTFMRTVKWGPDAENIANSLHKGDRVIATGALVQRDWETRDGEKRSTLELNADEIGASLKYRVAKLHKTQPDAAKQAPAASPAPQQHAPVYDAQHAAAVDQAWGINTTK